MSVNNNGRMLPPETLLIIFGHAESDPNHRPSFFINYQLVHRSWVEAAQIKLYNSVVLDPQDARTFVDSIQNNQNAGRYVRELVFNPGFAILAGLLEMLQTIFNRCPNIQVVYPKERANECLVWTFIAAMENPPRNIRILMPLEQITFVVRLQNVATVACRQTVTQVRLTATGVNQEARLTDNDPYYLVLQRLPDFPLLNWVTINDCPFSQIDFFVNRCRNTLNGLRLRNVYSPMAGQINNITPLPSITRLVIKMSYISMHLLVALQVKFNRLDYLEIVARNSDSLGDRGDYEALQFWWETLTNWFHRPQNFRLVKNFGPNFGLDFEQREHLRSFLNRTSEAPNLYKKLTVSCLYRPREKSINHQMELKRDGRSYEAIFYWGGLIRSYTTGRASLDLLDQLQTLLNEYRPKDIRITINSFDTIYNFSKIKKPNAAETVNLARYFPIQADATRLRRVLKADQKIDTWLLFSLMCNVVEQNVAAGPTGQVLIFDAALFVYPPHRAYTFPQNLQVSELHLCNSIIYHAMLPEISLRLPVITRLIINTCCIIMDSRYTLKVSLPTTRIQAIGLKLAPFAKATTTACDPDEICNLENYDLLEALSAKKPFLFKFQLEEQTFVVRKTAAGNLTLLGEDQHAITTGTPDEFLVWIHCRDLDALALDTSDKKWIYWEKKIRFKEL